MCFHLHFLMGTLVWAQLKLLGCVISQPLLRESCFVHSQPWDSCSAAWVNSVSVLISFKKCNKKKKTKLFSPAKIERHYLQNCHLITVLGPCNSLNLFWYRNPVTRAHTSLPSSSVSGKLMFLVQFPGLTSAPRAVPLFTPIYVCAQIQARNKLSMWKSCINHGLSWKAAKALPIWPSDMFPLGTCSL